MSSLSSFSVGPFSVFRRGGGNFPALHKSLTVFVPQQACGIEPAAAFTCCLLLLLLRDLNELTTTERKTNKNSLLKKLRSLCLQPDLLNFKKGWMSKLDEGGEVRPSVCLLQSCLSALRLSSASLVT